MSTFIQILLRIVAYTVFLVIGALNGCAAVNDMKDYLKTEERAPLFLFFINVVAFLVDVAGAIWILFGVSFA